MTRCVDQNCLSSKKKNFFLNCGKIHRTQNFHPDHFKCINRAITHTHAAARPSPASTSRMCRLLKLKLPPLNTGSPPVPSPDIHPSPVWLCGSDDARDLCKRNHTAFVLLRRVPFTWWNVLQGPPRPSRCQNLLLFEAGLTSRRMARPQSAFFKNSLPGGYSFVSPPRSPRAPSRDGTASPQPGDLASVSLTQGPKGPDQGQVLGAHTAPKDSWGCPRCPSWSEATLPSPCHFPSLLPGSGVCGMVTGPGRVARSAERGRPGSCHTFFALSKPSFQCAI